MTNVRRNRRLIEHIDPVTGARTYTDELTGEIVAQDQAVGYVTPAQATQATEVTETTVTERLTPGHPYTVAGPVSEQVTTQRTVSETPVVGATGAAPVSSATHVQESQVVTEDPYAPRRATASKIQQIIYLVFSILEALLAIRFVLMLLGANPAAGFASLIYGLTDPFLLPFAGLFGQPAAGGSLIEINTLVALVVYPLVAWLLAKLAWLITGEERSAVRTSRVNTRIDR